MQDDHPERPPLNVPRPTDDTDHELATEALALSRPFRDASESPYLHGEAAAAVFALRSGGGAAGHGDLLGAAFGTRYLIESALRVAWVYEGHEEGADELRKRTRRLEVLDLMQLRESDKAIRRDSGKPLLLNHQELIARLKELREQEAPGKAEVLAREARWDGLYSSYRLMSAMIHAGIAGCNLATRYVEQGGDFRALIRFYFAETTIGLREILRILYPTATLPDIFLNEQAHLRG